MIAKRRNDAKANNTLPICEIKKEYPLVENIIPAPSVIKIITIAISILARFFIYIR
jgi:hypothetical protein